MCVGERSQRNGKDGKTEDQSKNRNSEWKTERRKLFSSQYSQASQYSQYSQKQKLNKEKEK